ncbi:MAG: putative aminohydrolase SsnA [Anaerolineaceae bacterium]|jgi:putative selenium metabolism protein SsnA
MLVKNGTLITWDKPNQILEGYALHIENGLIHEMDHQSKLSERYPHDEILDAGGQLVMPGVICAHTHFYGAFARGLSTPATPAQDFPEILRKLWWPLDESLDEDGVYYSALVCLVDAIRHGTTTLIDHHASPNAIEGSLDAIAAAVDESGLRAGLCYEVTDRGGPVKANAGISENVRFIQRIKGGDNLDGRLVASFGLHASLTLTDDTLDACRNAIPDGFGFHVHVAEHPADEYDSVEKSGLRVVDRLHKHGILGTDSILVHAVHIDAREMQFVAESGSWVTHQPRSNMNNAVGMAEIESMLRMGIKVCLGNDGFSNAMWEEWKTAYLVHKLWHHDPRRMSGMDIVQMAVYNNAELASKMLGGVPVGVLKPGARADFIFVDYHPFTALTAGNLPWHILFGFRDSMVTTTVVAGKTLMHERKLLTIDEAEIANRAKEVSRATWQRYMDQFR